MLTEDNDGDKINFHSFFSSVFTLLIIGFGDNCYKIILSLAK